MCLLQIMTYFLVFLISHSWDISDITEDKIDGYLSTLNLFVIRWSEADIAHQ